MDGNEHEWVIKFDGGASPNPGRASCAFKAYNGIGHIIEDSWAMHGIRTNNEAEWEAISVGLERLISKDPSATLISVFGDSELVMNQMSGMYSVRSKKLKPYYMRVKNLKNNHRAAFTFKHIKREFNEAMDIACRSAR